VPELMLSPVLDQNSIAMNNIKLHLRSNTGIRQEVQIRDFSGQSVLDLKKIYFAAEIKNGKQIRLILNGKLIKDEDKINGLKIKNAAIMQAFITEPARPANSLTADTPPESQTATPVSFTDALGGYRGFDFFKANGYTDEEVIWKRYLYHADFILTKNFAKINDDQ